MNGLPDIIRDTRRDAARREPLALVTLLRIRGSAYRRPGARTLVGPEGQRNGSWEGQAEWQSVPTS